MNPANIAIGVDIEKIYRFKKLSLTKDKLLLSHIFTKNELSYCFSKAEASSHLAVRFAAKEAVFKALCNIGIGDTPLREIEITKLASGIPKVKLPGKQYSKITVHLSMSHNIDTAIAFVVITKN